MRKALTLLLIAVLVLSSLVMVGSVGANQPLSKRSVPEFTITFKAKSKTITITIKNQAYASYINGETYQLYYNIRHKQHSENTWTDRSWSLGGPGTLVPQSDSQYTVVSHSASSYSVGDQVDFQVQALLGGFSEFTPQNPWLPGHLVFGVPAAAESDWSSTQTITIEEFQTPSPEPTSTPYIEPQSNEQRLIFGVAAIVVVVAFGLVLLYRIKTK